MRKSLVQPSVWFMSFRSPSSTSSTVTVSKTSGDFFGLSSAGACDSSSTVPGGQLPHSGTQGGGESSSGGGGTTAAPLRPPRRKKKSSITQVGVGLTFTVGFRAEVSAEGNKGRQYVCLHRATERTSQPSLTTCSRATFHPLSNHHPVLRKHPTLSIFLLIIPNFLAFWSYSNLYLPFLLLL